MVVEVVWFVIFLYELYGLFIIGILLYNLYCGFGLENKVEGILVWL